MSSKYDEILNLPHFVSKKHPQMPKSDRAAQLAPYSALSGYEDAVEETAERNLESFKNDTNYEYDPDIEVAEESP